MTSYIQRYADEHVSYHSDKYNCSLIHPSEVKPFYRLELEKDHLTLDRLYYHVVREDRACCIREMLKAGDIPSSFCIVRIFRHDHMYGSFIYLKLSDVQKSKIFIRMVDEVLYIPNIRRDVTKFDPTFWSHFCSTIQWDDIKDHLSDQYHLIYRITISTKSLLYYKYSEQYPLSKRYGDFLSVIVTPDLPSLNHSDEEIRDIFTSALHSSVQQEKISNTVTYARIFYDVVMRVLSSSDHASMESIIEESIRNVLKMIE